MIVLIPHLVVIFFLKLNKPIKLLQELLANIPQWSSPEAACRPQCRRVSVQAAGSSGGGCSIFPQPGHWNLQVTCLPTSQHNLATDWAATRNKVVFFNRPGMVQMLLVVGGVWCRVCWPARAWRPWRLWRRTSWRTCPPGSPAPAPAGGGSSTPRPGTGGGELMVSRAWRFPKFSQSGRKPLR